MFRPLVHFFLIGALLIAAKGVYEGRRVEGPGITVQVSTDATGAEIESTIRDAILLNEAIRYGWDKRDPVVYTHLIRNMRFIDPDSIADDLTLYKRALEMNMQAHDPIVRARLLYRAGEALSYVPEGRMPSAEDLEAHREANPERFQRQGRVRFQHVFLSRTKRGDSLPADATAMRQQLSALGDESPKGLGDPLPGLRSEQSATLSKLEDDYGAEVARVVEEAIPGTWRGPVSSVYGLHYIRVTGKEPAYVPPLNVIVVEVRADWLREVRDELRKERMDALRAAYTVHIERVP
jgi:hypothetical protein